MKLFLPFFLCAFVLLAAIPAPSAEVLVDPFSEAPPSSPGQQAVAVANASYRNASGHLEALSDGLEPKSSEDANVPSFSFYPHEGTFEWIEYVFPSDMTLEGCAVYWKSGASLSNGAKARSEKGAGLPHFWKVLYQNGNGAWLPVAGAADAPALDRWNFCLFKPIKTKALRLALQQPSEFSVGLYEWKVVPSKAVAVVNDAPSELRLDDLIPQSAKVGYKSFRVNKYSTSEEARGVHVSVDGQACNHFIFAHASSVVTYAIPEGYTRFTAVGIAPSTHPGPTWTYQILADGKPLYKSAELRSYQNYQIKLEVVLPPGARLLTLVTDTAGDGTYDHSIWAEPKLIRLDPRPKLSGTPTPLKQPPEPAKASTFEIKCGSTGDQFLVAKKDKVLELNPKRGSVFRIVPGLNDSKMVSLELATNRDFYVRHKNGVLWLNERLKNNANFDSDATFNLIRPDENHARFEQYNRKGTFISLRDDGMLVLSSEATKDNSTFLLVPE